MAQVIGAVATALVTLIAAVAAAVVSIRTGHKVTEQKAALTGQSRKMDEQSDALSKIDHQTNATLSELREDIRRQGDEIKSLNERLMDMIGEKGPEPRRFRPPEAL